MTFFKKFLILAFFSLSFNAFSLGVGAQFNIVPVFSFNSEDEKASKSTGGSEGTKAFENFLLEGGAAFTLKTDNFPLALAVCNDWDFLNNHFDFSVTADYHFIELQTGNFSAFYAGLGAAAGTTLFTKDSDLKATLNLAPRAVFGLSWIFYDGFFEYFVQGAVQPEFSFFNDTDDTCDFSLKIPVNTGVRFYY